MKKFFPVCAVGALAAVLAINASSARASSVFDASVNVPPGVFFGSGNPNGGFVVDTENGVQVGLRAKYRQAGSVIDTAGTGIYDVVTGPETTATTGNSLSSSTHAAWNWEFVVNVGDNNLSDYTADVTISDNLGDAPVTLDVLTAYGDNAISAPSGGPVVAENSENFVFGPFSGFNENADATYNFSLDLFKTSSPATTLGSASMTVVVGNGGPVSAVPLPASLYSGMAMFGGILLYRFVRKNRLSIA